MIYRKGCPYHLSCSSQDRAKTERARPPQQITSDFHVTDPVDYMDVLCLQKNARFVMTDSGGIQEETSVLGIPCLTLRENTERPITVSEGTSTLVGKSSQDSTVCT